MVNVSGEERHIMSVADAGDKRILDPDVHAIAFKSIMDGSSFFCSRIIKRNYSHIFEEPVYKVFLAAFLDAIKKLIDCYRGYMNTVFEISLFKKSRARMSLFEVVNNDVRVYNNSGFHFSQFLRSSLMGFQYQRPSMRLQTQKIP